MTETWQVVAAGTPPTIAVLVAVWRFARLETAVKNQHKCQHLLVKAVSRLNYRTRKLTDRFDRHLTKQEEQV